MLETTMVIAIFRYTPASYVSLGIHGTGTMLTTVQQIWHTQVAHPHYYYVLNTCKGNSEQNQEYMHSKYLQSCLQRVHSNTIYTDPLLVGL